MTELLERNSQDVVQVVVIMILMIHELDKSRSVSKLLFNICIVSVGLEYTKSQFGYALTYTLLHLRVWIHNSVEEFFERTWVVQMV